jgi:hypothetical protein
MVSKITLFIISTFVLLTSFSIMVLPQANALTQSTYNFSPTTVRWGNSKVCGDHICATGEHDKWVNAIAQSQKIGTGKVGTNSLGEDVMHKMVNTIPAPPITH